MVVIDPIRTRTAKQADWHIQIRPGTDGALALAMMNVIIAEDLVDHDYVDKYTLGYDELKVRAAQYPPERVACIVWALVPVDDNANQEVVEGIVRAYDASALDSAPNGDGSQGLSSRATEFRLS